MNQELARTHLIMHSRTDKNGVFPTSFNLEAKKTNPICGDHVELRLHTDNQKIQEIGHKAQACAICSASASILCEELKGKAIGEVQHLAEIFERAVMDTGHHPWPAELVAFNCFEHLRVNPSRKMCALLPWLVLKSALKKGHA